MTFFATSYVIPLALICGLYLRMLIRLWTGAAPGGQVSAEGRRGRKRATRMVVVVVAIFAFCWCPIQVSDVIMFVYFVFVFAFFFKRFPSFSFLSPPPPALSFSLCVRAILFKIFSPLILFDSRVIYKSFALPKFLFFHRFEPYLGFPFPEWN